MQKKIILGLDISTTCTGTSIVEYDGEKVKVLYIGHVKFKIPKDITGDEGLFLKSQQFANEFVEKYKDVGITDVVIEQPLVSSNNQLTVSTLLRFNGMLSQLIYMKTGIVPYYISSYDARKFAFPELMAVRKFDKKDNLYDIRKIRHAIAKNELVLFGNYSFNCEKKMILWSKISEMYPDIQWVYNKKGDLKTENFDASDSLVCVLGYINQLQYGETNPVITESNEKKITNSDGEEYTAITYTTSFCGETFTKTMTF